MELVKSGRVTVNGITVTDPARRIAGSDLVALDGNRVSPESVKRYIMLNKPRGYTCSNADSHAKKLAVDLIGIPERVYSAGRLDKDSEGLILFSNDGEYVHTLGHPGFGVRKRYLVRLERELRQEEIDRLMQGITDQDEVLKPDLIESLGKCLYRFTLNEGKNREIRRMAAFCGTEVKRLCRISVGKLQLGNLAPGKWRELTPREVQDSLSQE